MVRKGDITIAKYYLSAEEVGSLNRLAIIFLEAAKLRVKECKDLTLPKRQCRWNYVQQFNEATEALLALTPTIAGVDALAGRVFDDFKSKYLDIHDKVKKQTDPEKVSVLEEVYFELRLIHRDEINVAYILNLLINLKGLPPEEAREAPEGDSRHAGRRSAAAQQAQTDRSVHRG